MKRRVWVCIGLIVCLQLLTGRAKAQSAAISAAPVGIPGTVKNAVDAKAYLPQIQQFIQGQFDALAGQDPQAQQAARDKLINEGASGSSPSYLETYATVLDAAARKILSKNPPLRVRLNIAVIVYRVGMVARTKAFEGSVLVLINDPSEPVVLRGLQAAKPVVAAIFTNPVDAGKSVLVPAILKAVKAQSKSGLVAAEAYRALMPDPSLPAAQRKIADPLVLGPILDIFNFRISLYATGIPNNPAAEIDVPTFLYHSYQNANVAVQHRIVQTLVNYITVAGQQAPAATKPQLEQIIQTLIYSAGAMSVNIPTVHSALDPIVNISKSSTGPVVAEKTKPVFGMLQPFLPFLQPPPPVTPTTAPTTAP